MKIIAFVLSIYSFYSVGYSQCTSAVYLMDNKKKIDRSILELTGMSQESIDRALESLNSSGLLFSLDLYELGSIFKYKEEYTPPDLLQPNWTTVEPINIYFKDYKSSTLQTVDVQCMGRGSGKKYLVRDRFDQFLEWHYVDRDTLINGIACKLATVGAVRAWYSEEFSYPDGPLYFGGLKGLILHLETSESIFTVRSIDAVTCPESREQIDTKGVKDTIDFKEYRRRSMAMNCGRVPFDIVAEGK